MNLNNLLAHNWKKEAIDEALKSAVRIEIEKVDPKQKKPELQKLILSLERRLEYHRGQLLHQKQKSDRLGYFLAIAIPLGAAIITFLTAIDKYSTTGATPGFILQLLPHLPLIGLVLTLFTILFTVFKPIEKNLAASQTLILLHDWELKLFNCLRKHNNDQGNTSLFEELMALDMDLSGLGTTISIILVPQSPSLFGTKTSGGSSPVNGEKALASKNL
jgi:hypothetical protein